MAPSSPVQCHNHYVKHLTIQTVPVRAQCCFLHLFFDDSGQSGNNPKELNSEDGVLALKWAPMA